MASRITNSTVWFDTEFIAIPEKNLLLPLSLGFVDAQDRKLYVVVTDTDRSLGDDFVQQFVVPYLDVEPEGATVVRGTPAEVRGAIREWAPLRSQFWAWFASHDWVLLCNIMGGFLNVPRGWPQYVRDLRQEAGYTTFPDMPGSQKHNALDDAIELKWRHQWWEAQRA